MVDSTLDPKAHTQSQVEAGPDFCYECSEEYGWVEWPCPGSVLTARLVEAEAQLDEANAKLAGWERDWFDVQKPRLDEAVRLLDHFDRYQVGSMDYQGSPFQAEVTTFLAARRP